MMTFKNSIEWAIVPTLLKVTLSHGCFSRFLNCTNGTKSRNPSHFMYIHCIYPLFYLHVYLTRKNINKVVLPAFACSKLTIQTLEQGVKYVQN